MNTELEERLTERMQRLADQVPVPGVRPEDDLVRGRRRVRVRRTSGVAAAVAVGVIAGGTGYLLHDPTPARTVVAPADGGGNASAYLKPMKKGDKAPGMSMKEVPGGFKMTFDRRLDGYRDAVAAVLDPDGKHLDAKVSNEQSGTGGLGTKLGWKVGKGLGEIMVQVSRPGHDDDAGFDDFASPDCVALPGRPCTPLTLADGTAGVTQSSGGELAVYYTRPDKQVVMIVETKLFGNNSLVPIHALPATAKQLLQAAADPRMTLKM
ncbi:MAG TPA: hypothetical protein VF426_00855 [Marmoricola sp.]